MRKRFNSPATPAHSPCKPLLPGNCHHTGAHECHLHTTAVKISCLPVTNPLSTRAVPFRIPKSRVDSRRSAAQFREFLQHHRMSFPHVRQKGEKKLPCAGKFLPSLLVPDLTLLYTAAADPGGCPRSREVLPKGKPRFPGRVSVYALTANPNSYANE